jgi:hypothetical protein
MTHLGGRELKRTLEKVRKSREGREVDKGCLS